MGKTLTELITRSESLKGQIRHAIWEFQKDFPEVTVTSINTELINTVHGPLYSFVPKIEIKGV